MSTRHAIRVLTSVFCVATLLCTATQAELPAAAHPAAAASEIPVPVVRRLNRVEYANSLRDLFGIEFPFTDELPADGQAGGFDTIGDALSLSPLLLEGYLKVARKVSNLVLGLGDNSAVTEQFAVKESQSEWVAGMPLGTRGGMRVKYYFPRTADYELRALLGNLTLDGQPYNVLNPTEGVRSFRTRVKVEAGTHVFVATFPDDYSEPEGPVPTPAGYGGRALGGPLDIRATAITPTIEFWLDGKKIKSFDVHGPAFGEVTVEVQPGPPIMASVEITGPFNPAAASGASARLKSLNCVPKRPAQERDCAQRILASIGARAYRRPMTPSDLAPILAAYDRKRKTADFDQALGMGLRRILVSPAFLFRIEADPPGAVPGQTYRISDYELATRLSYFLWSSLPDEQLLREAGRGALKNPVTLDREIHRLLSDRRADALVDNFAIQWLGLRDVESFRADPMTYTVEFDDVLPHEFVQETRLFMRALFRENRSILDVISGDYTFLNERLAKLYGIDGVKGPAFRKVEIQPGAQRSGVITQGSVLMATSHPAQTSPILRGKWILANLLNKPPPTPPPGVPPLNTKPADDGRKLTTREQIERHRISPVCVSCHAKMDPYGFALENYDVIGRWRREDNGSAIDASSQLPRGEPFTGPAGLKTQLLGRSEEFAIAMTSRLMMYALGRKLEESDTAAVKQIVKTAESSHYRFAAIVIGIVHSQPFQMRQTRRFEDGQQVAEVQ